LVHEHFSSKAIGCRAPGRAEIHRAGPRLEIGDQILHRIDRQRLVDHEHVAEFGRQRDLDEVTAHVEWKVVAHQRRNDLAAEAADQKRIAVRRSAHDVAHADETIAAGPVFDHHALIEPRLQRFRHQPSHHVGDPARRECNNESDRAGRISVVSLRAGEGHEEERKHTQS
jgi:hypothetical protein